MFEFFDILLKPIITLLNFVINLITTIINFFVMVGKSIIYLFDAFAQLPAFVAPFCYLTVAIAVVFVIINRKGSS